MAEPADKVVRIDGARITQARELRGYYKRDLAEKVGVSEGIVGDWETKGVLRRSNFDKLCAALRFPPEYFFQGASNISLTTPTFRRLASAGSMKNIAQASGYGRMVGEFLRVLDRSVGLPTLKVPFIPASDVFDEREIAAIAHRVRIALGLGEGPIQNASRAVEDVGVVLCFAGFLPRGIDSYAAHSNGRPIVVLNTEDPERLRLDVLHELGHIVMHRIDPNESMLPQDVQVERLKVREAQAFRFASEMLMPPTAELRNDLKLALSGSYWTVAIDKVKPKWGVSLQAMVRRGLDLGLISEAQYTERMKYISSKHWTKKEPGSFAFSEAPGLLSRKYDELKKIFPDADERLAREPGLSTEFIRQLTARSPKPPEAGVA